MDVMTVELPQNEKIGANITGVEVNPKIAGVTVHEDLTGRDAADQHPIRAIVGLQKELNGKQPTGNYLTNDNLQSAVNTALAQAKSSGEFDGAQGPKGADGCSPTISVLKTDDGHRVSITDAAGEKHFDVMDATGDISGIAVTAAGESIVLTDSAEKMLEGLTLYGKTTQDGTPSPSNPIPLVSVGNGAGINLAVSNKNLYVSANKTVAVNGITAEFESDGTVIFNGTSTGVFGYIFPLSGPIPVGARYSLSINNPEVVGTAFADSVAIRVVNVQDNISTGTEKYSTNNCAAYKKNNTANGLSESFVAKGLQVRVAAGITLTNFIIKPQIEINSVATVYEEPEHLFLTLQTPNKLPGIPVASGGNYTDENGQQWWCDTVDFEKGVIEKRVLSFTLDGSQTVRTSNMNISDTHARVWFNIGTFERLNGSLIISDRLPATLETNRNGIYITAEPYIAVTLEKAIAGSTLDEIKAWLAANPVHAVLARTDVVIEHLDAGTLTVYKALHTNRPVTTVLNDGGAGMSVSYVADTKAYIDNKFAALEAAILSTGGNV